MSERPDRPSSSSSSHPALIRARTLLEARWLNSPPLLVATEAKDGQAHLNFIDPAVADHVILLDFWDYTCFHCLRTLPYLQAWHTRYAALGLTIIGIHTPQFSFGGERTHVERSLRELGIRYPVVIDADYTFWRTLDNHEWPRKILLDRVGQAVLDHAGEGSYVQIETRLQEALREGHPDLALPPLLEPLRPEDAPGVAMHPTTPELYCGFLRGTVGNREGLDPTGGVVDYPDEPRRAADTLYLAGPWSATRESLRTAPVAGRPAVLKLRCRGAGMNAVLRGPAGAATARVTLDGRPVPAARRGADLVETAGGETQLLVDAPRLYSLAGGGEHRKLELAIEVENGALEAFAFSFSSSIQTG
jgi:thiol-disulfide isomerase/thioredoxin